MCEIDFDEPFGFYVETWRKAAKDHRCDACGQRIRRGTRYKRVAYASDGVAASERSCLACHRLMCRFGAAHGFAYTQPSALVELIRSCLDDFDEDSKKWARDLRALARRSCRNPWVRVAPALDAT